MDFSTIITDGTFQGLVQTGLLERKANDTLFPWLQFRDRFVQQKQGSHEGTDGVMSRPGLIPSDGEPLRAGVDPDPTAFTYEQWTFLIEQYAQTFDIHMPTSVAAAFPHFEQAVSRLALAAGRTLNLLARNAAFNAALAGNTVTVGSHTFNAVTAGTLSVARLNGFTEARVPGTVGASQVRYAAVSSVNPLSITVSGLTNVKVVGYTPTYTLRTGRPDTAGPGTLSITFDTATNVTINARTAVLAIDRSLPIRVGGGSSIDSLSAGTDVVTTASFQSAMVQMRDDYVPYQPDGMMHCDLSPQHQQSLIQDATFQRLYRGKGIGGENVPFQRGVVAELFGLKFFENTECPKPSNVAGGTTAGYSTADRFGAELYVGGTTSGATVIRSLVTGGDALYERYVDLSGLLTEAGLQVRTSGAVARANGITVVADNVQMMIRPPLDRLAQQVSTTYSYQGCFTAAPDGSSTTSAQRFKRVSCIESV